MSAAKNNCHVSLPSLVSKVFEKLVNNRIVLLDQLQIFSQLYPVRIARDFNRTGATRAVARNTSKAFDSV